VRGVPHGLWTAARAARQTALDLLDLVLPAECAGCAAPAASGGLCGSCASVLTRPPAPTRPTPAPEALPPCVALGEYEGPLRGLILAYKERGRRELAIPLGDGLATVVAAAAEARGNGVALIMVPVPTSAAAMRARHGDHMWLLAQRAAQRLRLAGYLVGVAAPVRARSRADSAHLDRFARARSAHQAFAGLPLRMQALRELAAAGATVMLVDDVVTTGSTLAALARRLARGGIVADGAAVLAATRLRRLAPLAPVANISNEGLV
jgi:predicted amidophosphoribosyltransferase